MPILLKNHNDETVEKNNDVCIAVSDSDDTLPDLPFRQRRLDRLEPGQVAIGPEAAAAVAALRTQQEAELNQSIIIDRARVWIFFIIA